MNVSITKHVFWTFICKLKEIFNLFYNYAIIIFTSFRMKKKIVKKVNFEVPVHVWLKMMTSFVDQNEFQVLTFIDLILINACDLFPTTIIQTKWYKPKVILRPKKNRSTPPPLSPHTHKNSNDKDINNNNKARSTHKLISAINYIWEFCLL